MYGMTRSIAPSIIKRTGGAAKWAGIMLRGLRKRDSLMLCAHGALLAAHQARIINMKTASDISAAALIVIAERHHRVSLVENGAIV